MTGFTTKAIHTTDRDNPYGSILPPIYTTTTYAQPCDGTEGPYDYQRGGNPTRAALETTLATLEGAKHAFAYPSGMGATAAALGILKEGETLLLGMPSTWAAMPTCSEASLQPTTTRSPSASGTCR